MVRVLNEYLEYVIDEDEPAGEAIVSWSKYDNDTRLSKAARINIRRFMIRHKYFTSGTKYDGKDKAVEAMRQWRERCGLLDVSHDQTIRTAVIDKINAEVKAVSSQWKKESMWGIGQLGHDGGSPKKRVALDPVDRAPRTALKVHNRAKVRAELPDWDGRLTVSSISFVLSYLTDCRIG